MSAEWSLEKHLCFTCLFVAYNFLWQKKAAPENQFQRDRLFEEPTYLA